MILRITGRFATRACKGRDFPLTPSYRETLRFSLKPSCITARILQHEYDITHSVYIIFVVFVYAFITLQYIHKKRRAINHSVASLFSYLIIKMVSRHPHLFWKNEKRNHHYSQGNQYHEYSSLARAYN